MNDPHVVTFVDDWDVTTGVYHFRTEKDAMNFIASHASRKSVDADGNVSYDMFDKKHWDGYMVEPYVAPDFQECPEPVDMTIRVPFPYKEGPNWYYRTQEEVDVVMRINGYAPDGRRLTDEERGIRR